MLPQTLHNLAPEEIRIIADKVRAPFIRAVTQMAIETDLESDLLKLYIPLAATLKRLAQDQHGPLVIGFNGAQGAGKSTLCQLLQIVLETGFDQRVATLSIDDLYLPRADRKELAQRIHPLLSTRGVPGTHDVEFGLQLLDSLRQLQPKQTLQVPVFDKAIDDRLPSDEWRQVAGPFDLVLFEGWCVGAIPQPEDVLLEPINSLERDEDPDRVWRSYVNQQLQEGYSRLFAELDYLIMLKVPGMQSVHSWRTQQEQKLAADTAQQKNHKIMDANGLRRFIMHYERLTQSTLIEMPGRANLVLNLNSEHQIDAVRLKKG